MEASCAAHFCLWKNLPVLSISTVSLCTQQPNMTNSREWEKLRLWSRNTFISILVNTFSWRYLRLVSYWRIFVFMPGLCYRFPYACQAFHSNLFSCTGPLSWHPAIISCSPKEEVSNIASGFNYSHLCLNSAEFDVLLTMERWQVASNSFQGVQEEPLEDTRENQCISAHCDD